MEQQSDAQMLRMRVNLLVQELRKSEAYPAIVGGIAGGIAGALMAVIIAGALSSRRPTKAEPDAAPTAAKSAFSISLRDAVQLLTVIASLVKQIQAWSKEQGRK